MRSIPAASAVIVVALSGSHGICCSCNGTATEGRLYACRRRDRVSQRRNRKGVHAGRFLHRAEVRIPLPPAVAVAARALIQRRFGSPTKCSWQASRRQLGDFAFRRRRGGLPWHLFMPPLSFARSCTDAQTIHNKESNGSKCDQAVGHNMQHASFLRSHGPAWHEN